MGHFSLPLVATVGGAVSNTYVTLAEANTYHTDVRSFNTEWTAATDPVKNSAILWAMSLIESRIKWKGTKADSKQSLDWPRYYAYSGDGYLIGYDYNAGGYIIPEELKSAVSELAYLLIVSDRTAEVSSKGLKSLKVDVISLDFDSLDVSETIPESVMGLLSDLGIYRGPGASTVSLVRT